MKTKIETQATIRTCPCLVNTPLGMRVTNPFVKFFNLFVMFSLLYCVLSIYKIAPVTVENPSKVTSMQPRAPIDLPRKTQQLSQNHTLYDAFTFRDALRHRIHQTSSAIFKVIPKLNTLNYKKTLSIYHLTYIIYSS